MNHPHAQTYPAHELSRTFFGQTMAYFALAILSCAGGIFGGLYLLPPALIYNRGFLLLMFVTTLALVFTAKRWSRLNYGYLFLIIFSALFGLTLVPLLAYAALTAGIGIIGKAFLATVAMFAGLAVYGATTKRNLMGLGGWLMASLIGLIAVSLITLSLHFFGIQVWNNTLELIFSGLGVLVFAGFTAFDFQRILKRQNISSPMEAAIELFLDFILLFQNILRLILSLNRN